MTSVGVVIPSYNHEAFVGDAIRSVLGQTVDGLELVVVDDGSSDRSTDAIRAAFDEFPGRSARLIEQENAGAHAAIARGIAALDTPFCAVLNSDDLYEPERFEAMLPSMPEPRSTAPHAIAFSGLTLIDEASKPLDAGHDWAAWYARALEAAGTEPTIGFALLVHNFSVTSGNFLFTRGLYDRLGGFGDHRFVHDWDFLLRATALTEPVFVRDKAMRYRVHGSNTTETVRDLLASECDRAVNAYAGMLAAGAENRLCPCPEHWPTYWDRFVATRTAFWQTGRGRHPIGRASPEVRAR
ncbi:MAG: glycosyltransferase family 2 protein [Planctomycetota bacterium]